MENFVCSLFVVWDTPADEDRFDGNNGVYWLDHQWDQVGCPDSLFSAAKKTCDVKLFCF